MSGARVRVDASPASFGSDPPFASASWRATASRSIGSEIRWSGRDSGRARPHRAGPPSAAGTQLSTAKDPLPLPSPSADCRRTPAIWHSRALLCLPRRPQVPNCQRASAAPRLRLRPSQQGCAIPPSGRRRPSGGVEGPQGASGHPPTRGDRPRADRCPSPSRPPSATQLLPRIPHRACPATQLRLGRLAHRALREARIAAASACAARERGMPARRRPPGTRNGLRPAGVNGTIDALGTYASHLTPGRRCGGLSLLGMATGRGPPRSGARTRERPPLPAKNAAVEPAGGLPSI